MPKSVALTSIEAKEEARLYVSELTIIIRGICAGRGATLIHQISLCLPMHNREVDWLTSSACCRNGQWPRYAAPSENAQINRYLAEHLQAQEGTRRQRSVSPAARGTSSSAP